MSKHQSPSNAKQSRANLDYWLDSRGLRGNPFERWNAEHEEDLPNYFVDVGEFDSLLKLTKPCIVLAHRSCGKTAQRQMLAAHCRPLKRDSPQLAVTYTYSGFERALRSVDDDIERIHAMHHVSTLLYLALTALMNEAKHDSQVQNALMSSGVESRLAAYVAHFAPHLANTSISERPSALDTFSSVELLQGFSEIVKEAGLEWCVVLVDGLDEFPLTADDPSNAVAFLAPLLGTLSLIECPGWIFRFFLPQELKPTLYTRPWFRADRLLIFPIAWTEGDLLALMKQRLTHFSQRKTPYEDLAQLCEDELAQVIDEELIVQARNLPRAALILADMLLQSHCQQPGPPELIALGTWEQVKEEWRNRRLDFVEDDFSAAQQPETVKLMPSPMPAKSDNPVLRIEEEKGLVWLGEREIRSKINPKDYSVLVCLYRHKLAVCSKDLIAKEAWSEEESKGISDQAIAASIARLRKVLKAEAPAANYIETLKGRRRVAGGYRLYPEGFEFI